MVGSKEKNEKPPCQPGSHDLERVHPPRGQEKFHAISGRPGRYFYCRTCDRYYWEGDKALSEEESDGETIPEEMRWKEDEDEDEEEEDD